MQRLFKMADPRDCGWKSYVKKVYNTVDYLIRVGPDVSPAATTKVRVRVEPKNSTGYLMLSIVR